LGVITFSWKNEAITSINIFLSEMCKKRRKIRDSKISAYENYELENSLDEQTGDILERIIEKKWVENRDIDKLSFIIPQDVNIVNSEIRVEVPQLWAKFDLLKLCYKNIYEYAHKKYVDSLSTKSFSRATMKSLLDILWYEE